MKFESTAPTTGATVYRTKFPASVTTFGPSDLAGFILAPVYFPNMNASNATIEPTPNARVNKDAFLLTKTCIEYISRRVIEISIIQLFVVETLGIVSPETTIIAANHAPIHCEIMYPGNAFVSKSPLAANAIETAGFMCAPDIG